MSSDSDTQHQFQARRYRQRIANMVALAAGLLLLWLERESLSGDCQLRGGLASVVGFVTLFSAVIYGFINWRCPACNAYLASTGVREGCCYKCGVQLK